MQMIILAATEGTPMRIEAEGEDAEVAVAKLVELVEEANLVKSEAVGVCRQLTSETSEP